MLNAYTCEHSRLVPVELTAPGEVARVPVWIDLLNPTADEDSVVERRLGLDIPTRDEMQEIELSSRLYQEDGAEFLTVTVLMNLDGEQVRRPRSPSSSRGSRSSRCATPIPGPSLPSCCVHSGRRRFRARAGSW